MRTTLTLEPDVAAMLSRVRQRRGESLKDVVNAALREGLSRLDRPEPQRPRSYTRSVSLGPPRVGPLDNIAEVLATVEGDAHR